MANNKLNFEIPEKDNSLREGTAISNLDGRIWDELGKNVGRYFGDEALLRARVGIEARYLIALSKTKAVRKLTKKEERKLTTLHEKVDTKVYKDVRKIESEIRHDVLAMTKIFKKLLKKEKGLSEIIGEGWVHWGLTSEDVDNLSKAVLLKNFIEDVYLPQAAELLGCLLELDKKTIGVVIPAKTHLQPASPSLLSKEILLFGERLIEPLEKLKKHQYRGKLTGAVGNLSAQKSALPDINWKKVSKDFVKSLGLQPNLYTTQIEPKNSLFEMLGHVENINHILVDMSQDFRLYIGFDWLKQEVRDKESGSSTMPQKVNPIDFENAHGNALISNWFLTGFREKSLTSWLQRDLTDKTVLRNLGLPLGYSLLSLLSSGKGVKRASPDKDKLNEELDKDWSIIAEAYQVNLRANGYPGAYDELKKISRGKVITKNEMEKFIEKLKIPNNLKKKLKKITPKNYTGYAEENAKKMVKNIQSTIKELKK